MLSKKYYDNIDQDFFLCNNCCRSLLCNIAQDFHLLLVHGLTDSFYEENKVLLQFFTPFFNDDDSSGRNVA